MDIILASVVGITTGVLSSGLVWWTLNRRLRPKVWWAPQLSSHEDAVGNAFVRVQLANAGRRAAIDVHVIWRLRVEGLGNRSSYSYIALREDRIPHLAASGEEESTHRWTLNFARIAPDGFENYADYFPESLMARIRDGDSSLTVVDVMGAQPFLSPGSEATLEAYAYTTDSVSGARTLSHHSFRAADVVRGIFIGESTVVTPHGLDSRGRE